MASRTPTGTFTATPLPTATFTVTSTPTNTPTNTPTRTPTNTPTNTNTPTVTNTFTPTNTFTDTPTNTPAGTATPTADNSWFVQFTYTGDGTDNRDVSTGKAWTPEAAFIVGKGNGQRLVWHTASMAADSTCFFDASTACTTDRIQSFGAGTINIGANADVNTSAAVYVVMAFRSGGNGAGQFIQGSYTGNNSTPRSFTGFGFRPEAFMLYQTNANQGWFTNDSLQTDDADRACVMRDCTSGCCNTAIVGLDADGFTLQNLNTSPIVYYYLAFNKNALYVDTGKYAGATEASRSIATACTVADAVFSRGDTNVQLSECAAFRMRGVDATEASWGASDAVQQQFFSDFSGANFVVNGTISGTRNCDTLSINYYWWAMCNQ